MVLKMVPASFVSERTVKDATLSTKSTKILKIISGTSRGWHLKLSITRTFQA